LNDSFGNGDGGGGSVEEGDGSGCCSFGGEGFEEGEREGDDEIRVETSEDGVRFLFDDDCVERKGGKRWAKRERCQ